MSQVRDRSTGAVEPLQVVVASYPALTTADRCDAAAVTIDPETKTKVQGRCGAQAYIRAVFPDTGFDLLFCGHCLGAQPGPTGAVGRERRERLEAAGAVLHSEYQQAVGVTSASPAPAPGYGF